MGGDAGAFCRRTKDRLTVTFLWAFSRLQLAFARRV